MDEKSFEKLLEVVKELTPAQFKELTKAYATKNRLPEKTVWGNAVYGVAEQHLIKAGVNNCCPECGSISISCNGKSKAGIQVYFCKDCRNTYTRFSGTLLERSRYPWDVWVEVLRMTLSDYSVEKMKSRLESDFGCEGISIETLFYMRLKLIYAMAAMPLPKLSGVIQADETVLYESQKGSKKGLVSYIKGEERKPRVGRCPSKYGTLGAEFSTILTLIDDRGYCVCRFVSLGRATVEHVTDLFEEACYIPAFVCTDGNTIYSAYCDAVDIPHYIKPSGYNTIIDKAMLKPDCGKSPEEISQYNTRTIERLYKNGEIDRIEHREDLSYSEFKKIKKSHKLNLARVNELHSDIKLTLERKMTNIATKYLPAYIGFFTYRRNWRVEYGHYPTSTTDAEKILEELLPLKVAPTKSELKAVTLNPPKPSGRFMQLLKEKTEIARQHTANRYFKYDSEDIPSFNIREILLDAPRVRLNELAKSHSIKGYTKMSQWVLASTLAKLPDAEGIVVDLITTYRHYEIAEEDILYLKSLKYGKKKD